MSPSAVRGARQYPERLISLSSSLFDSASTGAAAPPAALVEAARALEVLSPSERRRVLRNEAGLLLDGLLARVARGRSAVDVALSEGLGALSVGDRALRLGFSGVGDYARERLGLAARTGQALSRLGRELSSRPLLLAAVRAGEVSLRAAQAVLPVSAGADEAAWVERARSMTVRGLLAAVREAGAPAGAEAGALGTAGGPGATASCAGVDAVAGGDDAGRLRAPPACAGVGGAGPADVPGTAAEPAGGIACVGATVCGDHEADDDEPGAEPWQRVVLEVDAGAREALDRALDLAGQVLGEGAPRWQRVEALAQEFLGAAGSDGPSDAAGGDRPCAEADAVAVLLAAWRGDGPGTASPWASEAWSGRGGASGRSPRSGRAGHLGEDPGWRQRLEAFLEEETERWAYLDRIAPVVAPAIEADVPPERLDAALRHLGALRERWESLLGHLALLFRMTGLWRDAQFTSFAHYCRERLGLGVRQVEARIALERRLHGLPRLRAALEAGRVDAEQARLVARVADPDDEARWLARAAEVPTASLQREVEAAEAAPPVASAVAARLCAPDAAQVEVRLRLPVRVASLLAEAMRAARRMTGGVGTGAEALGVVHRPWPGPATRTDAECLTLVAEHFLATWAGLPRARTTPQRRALRRDAHRCQVPGCSRRAVHAHHVRFRSHGGADEEANLVSLCAAHHLHGVHRGFLRVRGVAPHALTWEVVALGERWGPGAPAEAGGRDRGPGAPGARLHAA